MKTARSKSAIKAFLKGETKDRITKGKQILEEKLDLIKLKPSNRIFRKLLPNYQISTKEELYSKIAVGIINLDDLKKVLKKNTKNKWIKYWKLSFGSKQTVEDDNEEGKEVKKGPVYLREISEDAELNYTIAKCCNPIPGDDVVGFRDEFNQILIHKNKCPEAVKMSASFGNRITNV